MVTLEAAMTLEGKKRSDGMNPAEEHYSNIEYKNSGSVGTVPHQRYSRYLLKENKKSANFIKNN